MPEQPGKTLPSIPLNPAERTPGRRPEAKFLVLSLVSLADHALSQRTVSVPRDCVA